jgi:hypothetical protein
VSPTPSVWAEALAKQVWTGLDWRLGCKQE